MLAAFIQSHEADLVASCVERAVRRGGTAPPGTPPFLRALPGALGAARSHGLASIDPIAARHGMEMLANGAPLEWVVHQYGDVRQAITQLAQRRKATIPVRDFAVLNACLDRAIAVAVSEYAHQRELLSSREGSQAIPDGVARHRVPPRRDNGGRLRMRELPGGERIYTIDLRRERMVA